MRPPTADRAVLAQAVADAVRVVPGVARLSPGTSVEVATQYAGGKVIGVRLAEGDVSVHIVVDRLPVAGVAEAAGSAALGALGELGDRRPVEVVVEDLEFLGDGLPLCHQDLR